MTDVEDDAQVSEPGWPVADELFNTSSKTGGTYARVIRVSAEELNLEPAVHLREGSDLMEQLRDQLIMLPEIEELTPECNIDEANVGVPGVTTPGMEAKMRGILKRHRSSWETAMQLQPRLGAYKTSGFTREADCRTVFWCSNIKKLLEAELIEHSESEWSSPIVIVLKKNGIDIRIYPAILYP
ncbi:LOW QUALITY PROTEIN: reverse transcriptase [Phytophthora megakarya]|uniref:Reverse transcriptase n=1 Tax=Phytophthora megakarya TaxID=4795 RepID=A0A225UP14_9STRA|nr:LOW QUALITY PROTEIN: reverse transcriptase [Phytophthora megakarya]